MIQFGNKEAASIYIGGKEVATITIGGKTAYEKAAPVQIDYFYIENEYAGSNRLMLTSTMYLTPSPSDYSQTVEYSKDRTNWTTITFDTQTPYTISMDQGEKVYFRNDNGKFNYLNGSGYRTTFTASQNHSAGGNVMSLLDYTNMSTVSLTPGSFWYLFGNDTNLIDCSNIVLPATTLAENCYQSMFESTSITTPPTLPATTMAAGCYKFMFYGSELTTAPVLPATILARECYATMLGSTNITTAPVLPATTLAEGCYYSMFAATNITTAPVLPATVLAQDCYRYIFRECPLLNNIETYATDISATYCTLAWVRGVAATGTFYNYGSATYTSGISGIPTGWTEIKPVETPSISYVENLNKCGRPTGTGTVTITCGTTGASILYREATEIYDQVNDEYVFEDITQVQWSAYTAPMNYLYYDRGDGTDGRYKLQAKAVKTGLPDSLVREYIFTVQQEETCIIDCNDCSNWSECGYESYEDCDCKLNNNCPVDCTDFESLGYESYEECDCLENGSNCDCTDCSNWEQCGYSDYEDCDCAVNDNCPGETTDCSDFESLGYESYEDCDCQVNGNCPEETDCNDCSNWTECGYESYEDCDCQVNGNCPEETDCNDCSNWSECGYESYEDCECHVNGNCPEEEEPEEETEE